MVWAPAGLEDSTAHLVRACFQTPLGDLFDSEAPGSVLNCQAVRVHVSFSPIAEHVWDVEGGAGRAEDVPAALGSTAGVPMHVLGTGSRLCMALVG